MTSAIAATSKARVMRNGLNVATFVAGARASARALSDARAARADRRVVKSLRREAREINAAHAGRRPAAAADDDDDA